jgi:hypothetical protein
VAALSAAFTAGLIVVIVARHDTVVTPTPTGNLDRIPPPTGTVTPLSTQAIASACGLTTPDYLPSPTGFAMIVNQLDTQLPLHGIPNDPLIQGFLGGRFIGYLNNVALTPPRLGSPTPNLPMLPLAGAVVRDFPGVLEMYEGHYLFANDAEASAMAQHFITSEGNYSSGHRVDLQLATGFVAFQDTEGPNDGLHERAVLVYGSTGRLALQLSIQGGSSTTPMALRPTILEAIARFPSAC